MEKNDSYFMFEAIKEAKKGLLKNEVPIGAVIVKNNQIISKAHNKTETSKSPFAHAEILAIEKAVKKVGDWRLGGCTLYVTKEPCVMCMGAICSSKITRVVFGAEEKNNNEWTNKDLLSKNILNHKPQILGGVEKAECQVLLLQFFKDIRKIK